MLTKILLNGKEEEIENGITIEKLLQLRKIRKEVVTIELNNEIVSREKYADTVLKNKDVLEFIYFMGGGKFVCYVKFLKSGKLRPDPLR